VVLGSLDILPEATNLEEVAMDGRRTTSNMKNQLCSENHALKMELKTCTM
jgi:hypothetical protein